jgi:hypothetical protein
MTFVYRRLKANGALWDSLDMRADERKRFLRTAARPEPNLRGGVSAETRSLDQDNETCIAFLDSILCLDTKHSL